MSSQDNTRRRLLLVIGGVLGASLVCIALILVALLLTSRGGRVNPLEALILRVRLAAANAELERPAGADATVLCFEIIPGDNAAAVASRLRAQGVILDADLFTAYLRYWGLDSNLQVATYALRRNLTIPQVAKIITSPEASRITLRIIEGWRLEEVIALVERTPGLAFSASEFRALVDAGPTRPAQVQAFATRNSIPPGRSLEGFLYPATYALPACASAGDFVDQLMIAFDANVNAQMRAALAAQSRSLYQVVTMASIIEREAVVDGERPIIASVYWNRYENALSLSPSATMPVTLDADPTIQYALGNTRDPATWWPRLTVADYRGVISPYNTYLNRGLPPGPIANPRLASIQAAIYPAQTGYAFFRASCSGDGTHRFATTFQEHLANACN
jgi:UPF0755 protein